MTTLLIMRGLQGSGKSTFAKAWVAEDPDRRARVNRDTIREMMNNYSYSEATEKYVTRSRDALIKTLLGLGVSVVCDDTNLVNRTVKELLKVAALEKVEVRVEDLTSVPLELCIQRDLDRKEWRYGKWNIGEEVIRSAYNKYVKGKGYPLPMPTLSEDATEFAPYVPDTSKPRAIMIDIDGTVAKMVARSPYDETRVSEDIPNESVIRAVRAMVHAGYFPVFCSGRTDGCRDATEVWLREHVLFPPYQYVLYMRAKGDTRKDNVVKLELFDKNIRDNFNVAFVLDDRDQVVEAWRSIGLTCFQVAPGSF